MENIRIDPEEEKEIQETEELYGYHRSYPLTVDKELITLNDAIVDDVEIVNAEQSIARGANIETVRKSIKLWDQLGIRLHDVVYLDVDKSREEITINDFTEENIRTVNPGQLPLFLEPAQDEEILDSYLVELYAKRKGKSQMIFHSIHLSDFGNDLTTCIYAHEIAHTQINSTYGSCKSILNSEVVSILMEEIFASKIDPTLNTNKKDRYLGLYSISEIIVMLYLDAKKYTDKMDLSMYIQSFLEATNMANIYLTGSKAIKQEMQGYINSIFNGKRSVEDMLEHYDSTYEAVPKKLELIKKPFQK